MYYMYGYSYYYNDYYRYEEAVCDCRRTDYYYDRDFNFPCGENRRYAALSDAKKPTEKERKLKAANLLLARQAASDGQTNLKGRYSSKRYTSRYSKSYTYSN